MLFPILTRTLALGLLVAGVLSGPSASGQDRGYPPKFDGAREMVYREVDGVKLSCWVINPPKHVASDRRSAILFFFGGGWTSGSPKQFEQQARHLASRGMVAILCDYRVSSRHPVKVVDCVSDAREAFLWARKSADQLGVDPDKIVVAGGSAGGHLAACCGVLPKAGEALPAAMVLFNPAVVLAPVPGKFDPPEARALAMLKRMGAEPASLSPFHQVRKELPPTLIFHGKADTTVPYATVELFTEAMKKAGNRCQLEGFDGAGHGFFNNGRERNKYYDKTLDTMDRFLEENSLLTPLADAPKQ